MFASPHSTQNISKVFLSPDLPVIHLQPDSVVGVDAGDAHHQDGGEDEEDVKEGQA